MSHYTGVVVERWPYGSTSFSQATAAVYEADTLTVVCTDPDYDRAHGPMQVYQPGTWIEAHVTDQHGTILHAFEGQQGRQWDRLRRDEHWETMRRVQAIEDRVGMRRVG